MQGVAVQQNDLQVPKAAEGDRDAGDAVTGKIQADKRKVPQLWGWVRKQSGVCPRGDLCSLPLPSALTSWSPLGPSGVTSWPLPWGWLRALSKNSLPAPLPTQIWPTFMPPLPHQGYQLHLLPTPGASSISPPCPLPTPTTPSFSSDHHKPQTKLIPHCSKTFHDLQPGLLRVSELCPTQRYPGRRSCKSTCTSLAKPCPLIETVFAHR